MRGVDRPRILALDYGTVRIGVAVSDELGVLAHPRPIIPAQPTERALRQVVLLVTEEQIERVLVGLPRNMDGSEGLSARRVQKFVALLAPRLGCPISFVDERRSTVLASQLLRESGATTREQKSRVDSAAAAVLLQAYLDMSGRRT
jgi:putative holliday junction resolvase